MKALKVEKRKIVEVDIENKLEALQAAVGGYIETLQLVPDKAVMIVNEEGLLQGLAPNSYASAIAGTMIVGTAVIVGVDEDEFTDVPAEVARQLMIRFGG